MCFSECENNEKKYILVKVRMFFFDSSVMVFVGNDTNIIFPHCKLPEISLSGLGEQGHTRSLIKVIMSAMICSELCGPVTLYCV